MQFCKFHNELQVVTRNAASDFYVRIPVPPYAPAFAEENCPSPRVQSSCTPWGLVTNRRLTASKWGMEARKALSLLRAACSRGGQEDDVSSSPFGWRV
jgi:hypothetical protein